MFVQRRTPYSVIHNGVPISLSRCSLLKLKDHWTPHDNSPANASKEIKQHVSFHVHKWLVRRYQSSIDFMEVSAYSKRSVLSQIIQAWRSILILPSHLCLSLQIFSFLQVSPQKLRMHLYSPLRVRHALSISFCLILSIEYLAGEEIRRFHIMQLSQSSCHFFS